MLAIVLSRMLARPLAEIGSAARRIAEGDYAARVPRDGPDELASLADSFNQMAASLERQEAMRRDFIANAAHELRTPLTNLQGYLEALRDGVIVADRADVRVALGRGRAARPPVALARRARRGRRGRAGRRWSSSTSPTPSGGALDLAQPGLERAGLTVVVDVPGAPARARQRGPARPGPREPALQRRTLHAAGGTVTVRAERRPADLLVSIENSGDGIPPEDLDRVFERFYRVEKSRDRARGGAGIGLAIVKQLVESAGGRVGAESASGTTRFWFSLPA